MKVWFSAQKAGPFLGRVRVPGDKSISHRAIILGALAEGVTEVTGFLQGADSLATLGAFRAMGIKIDGPHAGQLSIHGGGLSGLRPPSAPLDLGNAGTAMRLLAGVLAAQPFDTLLIGDESLSRRPMRRVIDPLQQMGALIHSSPNGTAPLRIIGGRRLHGIDYQLPVASAQLKSALLLAGMYAHGRTSLTESAPSRDHTERMLSAFGYPLECDGAQVRIEGGGSLRATRIDIPADLSSAAFFLVGASINPNSDLLLEDVGINPTRNGVLTILNAMGANINLVNQRMIGGEPVADLHVRAAPLHGSVIPPELVPLAIDEFPAIFIAAACAHGTTIISGAAELRVKESDRIQVMADGLRALGIYAMPTPDGMIIHGGSLTGGEINSHGDHRIAMAFSIAATRASGIIRVRDCANVDTSFPKFVEVARSAGLDISAGRDSVP